MRPKINGLRIKRKLEGRQPTGKRVTFYLSTDLYKAFKAHCGAKSKPSQVVAELLKEYIASTPGPYRTEYRRKIAD